MCLYLAFVGVVWGAIGGNSLFVYKVLSVP